MSDEEKELIALQLIEDSARTGYRGVIRVRCGAVEENGRLVPLPEFMQRNDKHRPAGRTAPTIHLVCAGAKNCKRGIYPERSPQNRYLYPDAPKEPHCGCYYRLKQQYDDLPACTEAYANNPINGKQ